MVVIAGGDVCRNRIRPIGLLHFLSDGAHFCAPFFHAGSKRIADVRDVRGEMCATDLCDVM